MLHIFFEFAVNKRKLKREVSVTTVCGVLRRDFDVTSTRQHPDRERFATVQSDRRGRQKRMSCQTTQLYLRDVGSIGKSH